MAVIVIIVVAILVLAVAAGPLLAMRNPAEAQPAGRVGRHRWLVWWGQVGYPPDHGDLRATAYSAVGVRWCRSIADRAGKGILMAGDVLAGWTLPNDTATAAIKRPPCRASVGEGAECGFQLAGDGSALA
jgi:hypothetical protein